MGCSELSDPGEVCRKRAPLESKDYKRVARYRINREEPPLRVLRLRPSGPREGAHGDERHEAVSQARRCSMSEQYDVPAHKRQLQPMHVPPTLQRKNRRKLIASGTVLAITVAVGVALWLSTAPTSPTRPVEAAGPVPAVETAPFAGALNALTAAPEVHYRATVPGMGTVDVKVTHFGELIGSVTEDGDTVQLLWVGGKLYAKPDAIGLPGFTSQRAASALKGKWLTGSEVQGLLGSIPARFSPPARLAAKLASALGAAPAFRGGTEIAGVPVVGADTTLGVLYVSANTPYHVVGLSPKASPSAPPVSSDASELAAYEPARPDMSFPVDPSSEGITSIDRQLEDQVQQLAKDAVDPDLHFSIEGNGSINCSDAGCSVSVTVANSINPVSAGVTITGGTVDADLVATITIEGTPTPGCTDEGSLPLGGAGVLMCDDPGAGAVFASVDAEKKAQAEAESQAENGAEVPYQVNYDGQYYVYARAQVNVAELEQQVIAQAKDEGKLQHAYSNLLSAMHRALNRTPAEVRASLTPQQLANGRANPSLQAAYIGTSIEKAMAADPAVVSDPDVLYMGSSRPGTPVADFKINIGGRSTTIDVTGPSPSSLSSHLSRSYIQNGSQLLLYPAPTQGFLDEVYR